MPTSSWLEVTPTICRPSTQRNSEPSSRRLVSTNSVTFTGQVPDARPYYAVMDAAINASAVEPFGIVILEAMWAGVPVVAVDAAGPREIMEGEAGGLRLKSPTDAEIADAIARVLSDDKLRHRLIESGGKRVRSTFSVDRMATEMERLLRSAAEGRVQNRRHPECHS